MPWIVFCLIALGVMRALRRLRARRPRGLCAGCRFVHMQYGATGRNAVFCTFGGVVRPVQIDVLYCTDYRDRSAEVRSARIGFAPGLSGIEAGSSAVGASTLATKKENGEAGDARSLHLPLFQPVLFQLEGLRFVMAICCCRWAWRSCFSA